MRGLFINNTRYYWYITFYDIIITTTRYIKWGVYEKNTTTYIFNNYWFCDGGLWRKANRTGTKRTSPYWGFLAADLITYANDDSINNVNNDITLLKAISLPNDSEQINIFWESSDIEVIKIQTTLE